MRALGPFRLVVVVIVAIAFPRLFPSALVTHIAVFTLIYATLACAWNILGGYSGYISLGHAAFFGIGAYSFAILSRDWGMQDGSSKFFMNGYGPFFLLPIVGLVAVAFAIPLGIITLRTRRHVFVVLTIAMLFIGQLLATNLRNITNGSTGYALPTPTWMGDFFNIPFYYAGLVLLACTLLTSWWIRKSKFGLGLLAIRDDEDRALGLGIRTGLFKLAAFVIAAFFISMAGALYGYFQAYIYPQFVFNPLDDLAMVLMTFTGGLGTLIGPVLGAFIVEPAHEYFAFEYGASGLYLVFYGALFLVIILLMPQGIWPALTGAWERRPGRARLRGRAKGSLSDGAIKEDIVIEPETVVKP